MAPSVLLFSAAHAAIPNHHFRRPRARILFLTASELRCCRPVQVSRCLPTKETIDDALVSGGSTPQAKPAARRLQIPEPSFYTHFVHINKYDVYTNISNILSTYRLS